MAEYRYDAFISYNEADLAWVQDELLLQLEKAGLNVLIDYRDFEIGVARLINIERAVDNSRHTLIVLTPAWIESEWAEFEGLLVSTTSPAGRRRKLIPLMLEPCTLPQRIAILTYADFTKTEGQEGQWQRLIAALKNGEEHAWDVASEANGLVRRTEKEECQPAIRKEPPTGFVNRESELLLLKPERLRARRSPYTLISAPAGYGKSYLLRRLIYISESEETIRQKWSFCYVDFGLQAGDQIDHVLRSMAVQPSPGGNDVSVDSICTYVVQELATPLSDGRRAVLLIFDAVERLCERARQWLYGLLHELYKRTRSGHKEIVTVRVVIAGRNAERFWEAYERRSPPLPAPRRIYLSPFDKRPIQELIWNQAQAAQIDLDNQTVIQMADQVRYLSGGHPGVIHSLVDDLAGQSFAIGPVMEYFARRREKLVQRVLSPVADDLLKSLEPTVREAVQTLSVFRRVNANTVQALVKAGALPAETNEVELLGELQRAHLLDSPTIQEPFYRDRFMQRILALDMAHRSAESRARYQRLSRVALDLYKSWIHNLGQALPGSHLMSIQRLLSVVEWLLHALQDQDVEKDALRSGLQAHIRALPDGDQLPSAAELIAGEISQDVEVCYLLRHHLGENNISTVVGWLRSL